MTAIELNAYHESGHAVVAELVYADVAYATIITDDWTLGGVGRDRRWGHTETCEDYFSEVLISAAGKTSEQLASYWDAPRKMAISNIERELSELEEDVLDESGRWRTEEYTFGDAFDIWKRYLPELSDHYQTQHSIFSEAVNRTYDLLRNPVIWRAVTNVAEALLVNEMVSGNKICDLVNDATDRSKWRLHKREDAVRYVLRWPYTRRAVDKQYYRWLINLLPTADQTGKIPHFSEMTKFDVERELLQLSYRL